MSVEISGTLYNSQVTTQALTPRIAYICTYVVRFEKKNSSTFKKGSTLLQRRRCGCKFCSPRIISCMFSFDFHA
jgi:hypothetical protein